MSQTAYFSPSASMYMYVIIPVPLPWRVAQVRQDPCSGIPPTPVLVLPLSPAPSCDEGQILWSVPLRWDPHKDWRAHDYIYCYAHIMQLALCGIIMMHVYSWLHTRSQPGSLVWRGTLLLQLCNDGLGICRAIRRQHCCTPRHSIQPKAYTQLNSQVTYTDAIRNYKLCHKQPNSPANLAMRALFSFEVT